MADDSLRDAATNAAAKITPPRHGPRSAWPCPVTNAIIHHAGMQRIADKLIGSTKATSSRPGASRIVASAA